MDRTAEPDGARDPGRRWWAVAGVSLLAAVVLLVVAGVPQAPPPVPVTVLAAGAGAVGVPDAAAGGIAGAPSDGVPVTDGGTRADAVLPLVAGPPAAGRVALADPATVGPATKTPSAATGLSRSVPVRLDIDRIGVHTSLMPLGLRADGTVDVPPLRSDAPAGWYDGSAAPGEAGPAVLLGHVDTARSGPAVFYRLGALRAGDVVRVARADGRVVRFRVTDVVLAPKDAFPTAAVYGPTPGPTLRLVTCGGSFDRRAHSYRDNTIVFATMVA